MRFRAGWLRIELSIEVGTPRTAPSTRQGQPSPLLFSGTENVLGNTTLRGVVGPPMTFSTDGTCSGPDVIGVATMVRAPTAPDALVVCTSLNPSFVSVVDLASLEANVPSDAWGCSVV